MNNLSIQFSRLSLSTILLSIVAACGGAGGDSGSNVPDNAAIEAVSPLVDIWLLQDDWNGTPGNTAYLVIESPDNEGVAKATIYDDDDAISSGGLNCFNVEGIGELTQSLDNRLFLELPIADFDSTIAELQPNGELEISVFAAGAAPIRVISATRVTEITVNEIPLCAAIEAVSPLVGIWELPDNWNDTSDDEAYLVISSPDIYGVAAATIYDLDDAIAGAERNCYLTDDKGDVRQSLTDELFLDLPAYNSAIAELLPNEELQISVFADGASGSSAPELVYTATRVTSITVNELPLC